ncbi:MFS transporter [Kutzneria buriramensis]|uniref:EmrB/QacA subfamily drug resistance transporter n=1 Tax=Kutzneria buriramensis TaxID=1045776 RepID=A0A3E0GU69_9PSEU|nr:MFS transporter [Kutzneria buriramensis]REH27110.1 EmrB/QacA subfamily drug resistance transporter [Kutzneria buriramensis]
MTAGFMALLDVSIVNVAIPALQGEFGASSADISWVAAGFALTFGVALVPAGRLGDERGRRRMLLIGLAAFTATSALCGLAPTPGWLVVARLLQGAACGLMNPQVIGMIQQLFPGDSRARALGLYGGVVAVSTAVGPVVGGLLLQWADWRGVFFVNVPIGVAALVVGKNLLPRDPTDRPRRSLDLVGAALLGTAVFTVMYMLIEADHWWLLTVAAALTTAFLAWERRYEGQPLVDLQLLGDRGYATGIVLALLYYAGYTGIFLVITLFLQQGLHYTPLQSGLSMTPIAIGSAITATYSGRLVFRLGRTLILTGVLTTAAGIALAALLIGDHTELLPAALLVTGLGSGLVFSPNQALALRGVPPQDGSTAGAVLQTCQRIGTAIGTALAGSLLFGELARTDDFRPAAALGLWGSALTLALAALAGGFTRRGRHLRREEES